MLLETNSLLLQIQHLKREIALTKVRDQKRILSRQMGDLQHKLTLLLSSPSPPQDHPHPLTLGDMVAALDTLPRHHRDI